MPHLALYLLIFCLPWVVVTEAKTAKVMKRPNILVVMVDDMGFSDLGCYGSEIETPVMDSLAANGLRFTQFYNTAKCHSSRVSLLSGMYCMQAGDVALSHCVTSAEILSKAGYFTMMSGKWHLEKEPTDFGFQRYFGHLSGACNYFTGDGTFRLNGKKWQVPDKDFYTTTAKVDFALKFLKEARETRKPWYLYVAFNAPHAPLHALEKDYQKYKGKYKVGWDTIYQARLKKQQKLGLFGKEVKAPARPDHVPAWDQLDDDWKTFEEMRMTALAAMIDRIDQEMGRLVADLKQAGELENTMILFLSDNGASPYDHRRSQRNLNQTAWDPEVKWGDSTGWAWARNAPFRFYKQNQFEGGICTPAIVHWPAGLKTKPGSVVDSPAHITDVFPTLAEICEAPVPKKWPGRELRQISGVSLAPVFETGKRERRPPIHLLFNEDRGLRDGDWKLVSFESQPWELYNLADDRTELNDLAAQHPERVKTMAATWHKMANDVLHAPEDATEPVSSVVSKVHRQWSDYGEAYNVTAAHERKHLQRRKNKP
jgi:arylsulfatase A-like enzyme